MSDTFTTNYAWTVPAIGTSAYAPKLNTDLQEIDTDLKAVSDAVVTAQAAAVAAQTTATSAEVATVAITPTVVVPGGSGVNRTASIDLTVVKPVYTIAVAISTTSTILLVTLTNRPATLGRLIALHVTTSGSGTLIVKIQAPSAQWTLFLQGNDMPSSGVQELGTITAGSQAAYALYVVAGV